MLVVDDDASVVDTYCFALKRAGLEPLSAASGREAIDKAEGSRVDLAVIDFRLSDMSGFDLVRALREDGRRMPFIVVSGFLNTHVTVDAMRLGAADVLDKPLDVDVLCAVVTQVLLDSSRDEERPPDDAGAAAAIRWAHLVLLGCAAPLDLKTLADWAHAARTSETGLRTLCRILRIRAHDARDFTRVLRAVCKGQRRSWDPAVFMDVHDERTLRVLFKRAGVVNTTAGLRCTVDEFIRAQQFIDPDAPPLVALRSLIAGKIK